MTSFVLIGAAKVTWRVSWVDYWL